MSREQEVKRVNRGYKLREDLIQECKHIAIRQKRKLYEVMEEALLEYIEKQQAKDSGQKSIL